MVDTLILQDVAMECRLGVEEWEQAAPQPVWIDVELAIDAARAAAHDDVRDAVDYAKLVEGLKGLTQHTAFHLLETLAEAAAAFILKEFGGTRVKVRVKKKALAGVGYAAVEVERHAPSAMTASADGRRRRSGARPRAARRPVGAYVATERSVSHSRTQVTGKPCDAV